MTAPGQRDFAYETFFHDAPDGMLVASRRGALLDANPRACAMLGWARDELLEVGVRAIANPADGAWEDAFSGPEIPKGRRLGLVSREGAVLEARVVSAGQDGDGPFGLVFETSEGGESGPQDDASRIGEVLLENGPDLITLQGADNTIRYVSPSIERILGYEPEELRGISALDLVHPEDLALADREARKASSASDRKSPPLRYRHKDGSWVYLENVATNLLHDPDLEAVVVDSRDVTGRKHEEEALRRSEQRYRALVGNSTGALTIVDADGIFKYASHAAQNVLGYAPEQLAGRNALSYVHPEDETRARELLEAASGGEGATETSAELRIEHADGSWRHLRAKAVYLVDEPCVGEFGGNLVVDLRDVTEQKEAEEALRQSEGRYRALVEQTKEGVYLADPRTMRILEANEALLDTLGYTAEELRRLTLYDLVDGDAASVDEDVRRTLREGRGHVSERRYRCKDGSLADIEEFAGVVSHEAGDVLCVVAHDLTGRKRVEENLRRSLGVLLALREAGQILGSTLETDEIVTRLLTIMRGVSGLTAAVISVEDELGQPRIWREVGLEGLWRRARFAAQAEEARRAVLDAGEHQLFRLHGPEGSGQLVGLCLPLRMKDRIAGVLEAYGPESLADEDVVEILRSLAAQAASALENARLYGELAERERRLADLIGQLFTAQEEERRRVAYEVHDGLAQLAAAAHQHLQGFADYYPPDSEEGRSLLSKALELVQRTVGEARRVIANLRPTVLDDFGLGKALRIEADRLRAEGYQVDYESNLGEDMRLPVAVETALFRVAQEALTNVRRHAGTRRVRLTLDQLKNRARLEVRDWGQGFDPSAPRTGEGPGERIGLNSMEERVALLGGSFSVQSRPGVGALMTAEVPLDVHGPADEARYPVGTVLGEEGAFAVESPEEL